MADTVEFPAPDVFSAACASRETLQHLTGRWGVLALAALMIAETPLRFGEVRRRIDGISDRMLSQTLSQLERDGLVARTVHSSIPPHVEYALTDVGRRIAEPLLTLIDLVEGELPAVLAAREAYDRREA